MTVVGMRFKGDQDIATANLRALLYRRERELQELHHRIANGLQLAAGFLILQQKQTDDLTVKAALDVTAKRLAAMGKLHRYLYAHSSESEVDLDLFLEQICPEIAQSTGLCCSVYAGSIRVSAEVAQHLAIVINELAMNAAKYAYAGRDGGELKIDCQREHNQLCLTVADGGDGFANEFDLNANKGLGMTIIGSIVQQLRGTFRAENDHGAKFTLTVPLG